jgi:uncharacterized protein YndB with AHSA1/START domain
MTPKTYEITVRKTLSATPEQVLAIWSDADAYNAVHACHETKIDYRPGGTIEVRFQEDQPGEETFVIRDIGDDRLVFCWEGAEENEVTVAVRPAGDGVEVAITQNCAEDLDWLANCLDGWAWIVDSMESWLETGEGIPNEEWSEKYGTHAVLRKAE